MSGSEFAFWLPRRARGRVPALGRLVLVALIFLIVGSLSASRAHASTFTWSGASESTLNWSNPANWQGGTAPSGTVDLDFPHLSSSTCASVAPTEACYESNDNVSGVTAESLHLDNGDFYELEGSQPLTLGAGGLTSEPESSEEGYAALFAPLTLSASQTWHIAGTSRTAIAHNIVALEDEVNGPGSALTVEASKGIGFLIGAHAEVGPVSIQGANPEGEKIANGLVGIGGGGTINSVDGEPVNLAHVFFFGSGKLGALHTEATTLAVGSEEATAGELEATSVTLDSKTAVEFEVHGTSSTPGVNYAPLRSPGSVELGSSTLLVLVPSIKNAPCQPPPIGHIYTLVSTEGELTGIFGNAAEDSLIPVTYLAKCGVQPAEKLQIEYHRSGPLKTVTATVIAGYTSTTVLEAAPGNSVTNQSVVLTATVQSSGETPSGTVDFENDGSTIPGCSSQPLVFGSSGRVATCVISFGVPESPEHLSAVFTPGASVDVQGSSSNTEDLAVGQADTTTTVSPSALTPSVGQGVTYTATVTPSYSGSYHPSGSVQFMDDGVPIGSCATQSLAPSGPSSAATCVVSYPTSGSHTISAQYSGDSDFSTSFSGTQTVTVQAPEAQEGPIFVPTPKIDFPAPEAGNVLFKGATVTIREHTVALPRLTCQGEGACSGKLTLSVREIAKSKGAKKARLVTIGSGSYSIEAGSSATVSVRLNARGRDLVARNHGRVAVTLRIVQKGSHSTIAKPIHLVEAKS